MSRDDVLRVLRELIHEHQALADLFRERGLVHGYEHEFERAEALRHAFRAVAHAPEGEGH